MLKERSELNLKLSGGEWKAVAREVFRAVRTHHGAERVLAPQEIPWYGRESLMLPVLEDLSGKRFTPELLPFLPLLDLYMQDVDNFFDTSDHFPSISETKEAVASSQTRFLRTISESSLSRDKKKTIFKNIALLRREEYKGLQQKEEWRGDPSFEEAYSYRFNTTGIFSEAVADLWCIATDTPEDKRPRIREAVRHIGMAIQYVDDFLDIKDDKPSDGNLVHAVLTEHPDEKTKITTELLNRKEGRLLKIFNGFAPESTRVLMKRLDDEISPLAEISVQTERTVRGLIKLMLSKSILTDSKDGSFYKRIKVW